MIGTAALERSVRELLRRVMVRAAHSPGGNGRRRLDLDASTVRWMLPRLVGLVDDLGDGPIEQLRPAVRRMLMEQAFVDDRGDAVMTDQERRLIDSQTDTILRILAHARRRAHASRQWSSVPVTPQMYG